MEEALILIEKRKEYDRNKKKEKKMKKILILFVHLFFQTLHILMNMIVKN